MTLPERRGGPGPVTPWGGWEPLREFTDVYERMGQFVREAFGEVGAGRPWSWAPWSAPVDLEETDDAYLAELDLPGVRKEDVSVDVLGTEVRVHGEVKQRERVGIVRRQTRRVGTFDYRFTLPGEVDVDKIEATLADGVLSIRAPKAEAAKPRRVQIKIT